MEECKMEDGGWKRDRDLTVNDESGEWLPPERCEVNRAGLP
jgi:hypothetical protein